MPIFTTPISSQNQATAAGSYSYPQLPQIKINSTYSDEFQRNTLNPAGGVAIYTETTTGTGTNSLTTNLALITMTTSANINDSNTIWTSQLQLSRQTKFVDSRSQVVFDLIFSGLSTAALKFFCGFMLQNSAITALPTTAGHMGLYVDTTVSNNYKLSSSDGTTQTTTDSGQSLSPAAEYRLNITWNGNNNATIGLYSTGPAFSTLIKSQTVTALQSSGDNLYLPYTIQIFLQTTSAATVTYKIRNWRAQIT